MCPMCWPPGATTTCSPRTGGRYDRRGPAEAVAPDLGRRRRTPPAGYSSVRVPIRSACAPGRGHCLLARRSLSDPAEIAYYICVGSRRTTLTELAVVAGSRWRVEECFQQAKKRGRPGPVTGAYLPCMVSTPPCPCSHTSLSPPGGKSADHHLTPITHATLDAKGSVKQLDTPGRTITHVPTTRSTQRNSRRQHQRIGAFGLGSRLGSAAGIVRR